METATILVLILSAGVVLSAATWALLGGFEISSSRNEASKRPTSRVADQEANVARCSIIGGSFRKTSQGCTSSQENERGIVTGSNGQKPKGAHHHAKRRNHHI